MTVYIFMTVSYRFFSVTLRPHVQTTNNRCNLTSIYHYHGACCRLPACCKLMQYTVATLTITEPYNNTTT